MYNFFPANNRLPFCLSLGIFLLVMVGVDYVRAETALSDTGISSPVVKENDASSPQEEKQSDKTSLVSADFLKGAGLIVRSLDDVGYIFGNMYERIVYAAGDIVFIDIGIENGAKVGDKYAIVTLEREVYHPILGKDISSESDGDGYLNSIKKLIFPGKKFMGRLVRQWGTVEIIETEAQYSKARVQEAVDRIRDGYRLIPYKDSEIPQLSADYMPPVKDIEGYIIALKRESAVAIGEQDVVYIDKGEIDNVSPGDRFQIYDIKEVKTEGNGYSFSPLKTIESRDTLGELLVIATQPETSTAIIVKSYREILVGMHIAYTPKGE